MEWDPRPAWLIVGDLNQARLCTEFSGQMKPLVLLCRQEAGLLDGPCSFLCILVGFPGQVG